MSVTPGPNEVCQKFPELVPEEFGVKTDLAKLDVRPPYDALTAWRLYTAVHYLLSERFSQKGIPDRRKDFKVGENAGGQLDREALALVAVLGRIGLEGHDDPHEGRGESQAPDDLLAEAKEDEPGSRRNKKVLVAPRFVEAVVSAFNDFSASAELHDAVFRLLNAEGVPDRADAPTEGGKPLSIVSGRQLVQVVDDLVRAGVSAGDPMLNLRVTAALSTVIGAAGDPLVRGSTVPVGLMLLEDNEATTLIAANIVPLGFLYQAAILEELKVPQVVDRIVQHWMEGTLPVTVGQGPNLLYQYFRTTQDRLTEIERRSVYARVFGLAQGSVEVELPNRDFQDLWIRFVASVSALSRESLPAFSGRQSVVKEQVHKAGRDLGSNLTFHGYGMVQFAGAELRNTYDKLLMKIISNAEILQAYGVRDRWQLVERVSSQYLAGAVNGVKLRTMALSGGAIIQWIANEAQNLSGASPPMDFLDRVMTRPIAQVPGSGPTTLAAEAERWLAVTGTTDQTVTQFAEPVSLTNQSTVPTLSLGNLQQLQQVARNLLPGTNIPQA